MPTVRSESNPEQSRAARSLAGVMPFAREWQEMLWESIMRKKSCHVTLRVKVTEGDVVQVQRVLDAVDSLKPR